MSRLASGTFVSLKAFGDLVILASVLRRLTPDNTVRFSLVIGSHLLELHSALGAPIRVMVVETGGGIPAIFDIRRRGWIRAARSFVSLRRELGALRLPPDSTLVFDQLGWRESLLCEPRSRVELPKSAANIYLAYEQFLKASNALDESLCCSYSEFATSDVIGIFPGSRVAAKALSAAVVRQLVQRCFEAGRSSRIFVLEGEAVDPAMPAFESVPRRFASMIDAVRSVDRLISADSLPAHLAEYFKIPVFVISSRPNQYWLPQSAFQRSAWALACDVNVGSRLHAFISVI